MFWCVAGGSLAKGDGGSAASSGVGAGYGRRGVVRAVLGRVAVLE